MISEDDIARMQQQLGELAIAVVGIDVDAFIEVAGEVDSAQALAAGILPAAVTTAGQWLEMARLLKPFRDEAISVVTALRLSRVAEEELVAPEHSCPTCGERRMDELVITDEDDVTCGTCGRLYALVAKEPE